LEHLNILASLFKSTGDNYGHNLVLRIIANAEVSGVSKSQSAGAILELGNKAHKAKDYEQAIKLWQQIENDYNNTPAWGKAVFNIGIALKEQKQFDDAIKQFEKLLTSNVNDMERGSNIMQAYRNYRAHAQWEIANCLLAQEKYCDALGAYQASQTKHAFHSWCGTCLDSYESRCALYQGLCLEHLRRYDEAVKAYFSWVTQRLSANSTMCIRIVDLYQSNNQIETLLKVLDEIDNYLKDKAVKEHGRQIVDDPDFDEHMFTKTIRRILEIRQLGKNQEVSSLVELVVTASPEVYPYRYRDRVRRWDAIEAAKALAQHPHKAVPLLKERMSGDNRSKLIYYALALCKTDEAVKILKESVPEAKNAWQKKSLEYAMTLLDKTYLPSEADDGIYFPDLPTNIGLPKKLSEIDEEAAFEESIPKSMNLDLSTPQATINSLLTAALIGNKNLYERCIWDCPELSRAYEDVAELSRKRTFRHEQSPSVFTSDDTAEITVQIADERKTERVVFILCSKNEQWLITGFRELRLSSTPTMP
jgi:tetratricopeptide (TPR) repeat protein